MAATGPATPQQDGQRDREARLHENHENHCLVAQKGRRKRRLPPALSPAPQALRRAHTWGGGRGAAPHGEESPSLPTCSIHDVYAKPGKQEQWTRVARGSLGP